MSRMQLNGQLKPIIAPSLSLSLNHVSLFSFPFAVMKVSATILTVLATVLAVSASNPHDSRALLSRHSRISARIPTLVAKSVKRKRCKARPTGVDNGVC